MELVIKIEPLPVQNTPTSYRYTPSIQIPPQKLAMPGLKSIVCLCLPIASEAYLSAAQILVSLESN